MGRDRALLPPLSEPAPAKLRSACGWAFGRYRQPIDDPSLAPLSRWQRLRTKEWHHHSVASETWFISVAVVKLGYLSTAFLYLVDRSDPARRREYEVLSPFGRAAQIAPSSVRGETRWQRGRDRIVMRYQDGWHLELDVELDRERLSGDLHIEPRASLALVFPLAPDRPAYTHKAAGLPARGSLKLGGRRLDFENGLASLDWTRSLANRHTRWKWASLSGRARDGRVVGLNLSTDVYDDASGASHENVAFLADTAYSLGPVRFELPARPEREPWKIASRDDGSVDLEFRPLGAREQKLHLGLLKSDFVQPYGTFHGSIAAEGAAVAPVVVDGVFGVVENHDARHQSAS